MDAESSFEHLSRCSIYRYIKSISINYSFTMILGNGRDKVPRRRKLMCVRQKWHLPALIISLLCK